VISSCASARLARSVSKRSPRHRGAFRIDQLGIDPNLRQTDARSLRGHSERQARPISHVDRFALEVKAVLRAITSSRKSATDRWSNRR